MAIYDNDGTTNYETKKVYDSDGTSNIETKEVYDTDGTTNYLIYSSWNGEIYDSGNIFQDLTGGWIKKNGSQIGASQIIYNSNNMVFQTKKNNGQNAEVIYSTAKSIDVTKYNKIKAIVDADMPSWSTGRLLAVGDKYAYLWDKTYEGAQGEYKTNWTIETDISNLRGAYPIQFSHGTSPSEPMTRIYKLWME